MKKKEIAIIIILLVIELISIFLMYKSSNNGEELIFDMNSTEEIEYNNIAIMIEKNDGTGYVESTTNKWPSNMELNSELSGCVDKNGNRIEEALSYENGIAKVNTSTTSYCYLYFDNKEPELSKVYLSNKLIELDNASDIGLQQTIITGDDLYRFSGTNGNTGIKNYICLGSTSCTSGSDNMYRIIGVNPSNGEVKVIKETPWNNATTYQWLNSYNTSTTWLTSELYTNTVASIYNILTFKDKIVTNHAWNVGTIGNTTDYNIDTRAEIIDLENNSTGTATIGILSLSDYYLAYNGDKSWNSNYDTSNWIGGYLNKSTSNEWTMNYGGPSGNNYIAWIIWSEGAIGPYNIFNECAIRPTFYLKQTVEYVSGAGTSTNPFIVS